MDNRLHFPATTDALWSLSKNPYRLGQAVGELLAMIPSMIHVHLNHDVRDRVLHSNLKPRPKTVDTTELTNVVYAALAELRTRDGLTAAFPDDLKVDRKERRLRRKYAPHYSDQIEQGLQARITQLMKHMVDWTGKDTSEFNKGFDKGFTGTAAWHRYPSHNVALKAGNEPWSIWLRKACEQLDKEASEAEFFQKH